MVNAIKPKIILNNNNNNKTIIIMIIVIMINDYVIIKKDIKKLLAFDYPCLRHILRVI